MKEKRGFTSKKTLYPLEEFCEALEEHLRCSSNQLPLTHS
jgi:hypothetical protein